MLDHQTLAQANGITFAIGEQVLLSGIDLIIREREIVSIIGPNGAGKTTLLRLLLGLLKPTRGVVRRRPNLVIGYVPQRVMIDPVLPIDVKRFLALGHRTKSERYEAVLGEVGIGNILDRPVQNLSGGEFQRLLLARALLRDPQLLVLDEPVQGVDVSGQAEIYELIARIRNIRGCGVLLVSHDLHIVMAATDRVLCINGHLCCEGAPEAVSQHPEYVALFGARLASEIAPYTHHHDHTHGPHGEVMPLATDHDDHDHRHHHHG